GGVGEASGGGRTPLGARLDRPPLFEQRERAARLGNPGRGTPAPDAALGGRPSGEGGTGDLRKRCLGIGTGIAAALIGWGCGVEPLHRSLRVDQVDPSAGSQVQAKTAPVEAESKAPDE